MTFPLAKNPSWGLNETLTSTQANTLQNNLAIALDCATLALGTTKTITRALWAAPMPDLFTNWRAGGTLVGTAIKTLVATNASLVMPLRVPQGAIITGFVVTIQGAAGHGAFPGGKPANMPQAFLSTYTISTGTQATVGSITDPSATAGAFEAIHATLTSTGLSVTVDNSINNYGIVFVSEGGANGILGDIVYGATVTYTMTNMDFD